VGENSKEVRFLQGQIDNLGKKYPDIKKLFSRPINMSKVNQLYRDIDNKAKKAKNVLL
jgi:hypothetical protein